MKNILTILLVTFVLASCKTEPKDYATISGKIENVNEQKKLTIFNRAGYSKEITVNDDGSFSDTLKVADGRYTFTDGNQYGTIFLKNDSEIVLNVDANKFDESLTFTGDLADNNNYIIESFRIQNEYLSEELFESDEASFDKTFEKLKTELQELRNKNVTIDTAFFATDKSDFERRYKAYKSYHNSKIALRKAFPVGMESPVFENYENFAGGTTSLSDLKGKYVYIDVWATWCGPCKAEIPSLKKVEKAYHDKNIEFVSISVDDARRSGSDEKAHEAWKTMVADKELGGVQLFSDKAWQSDFIQAYKINSIPRFLLIDPEGNVVSADAPRPSSESLIKLFDSLGI